MNSTADEATLELETPVSAMPTSDAKQIFQPEVVVEKDRPRFTAVTQTLLRSRLTYAALDISVVLGLAYLGNLLVRNTALLGLRTVILATVFGSYILLRQKRDFSLLLLRTFEALLFGAAAVQLAMMMSARLIHFAQADDAVAVVGTKYLYLTAFCLHVLTYGIFMPNTWKRAAVVTTILALIPYAAWFGLVSYDPRLRELDALNQAYSPVPFTLIAALIATFGSHIINVTRREAFQAKQLMQYRLKTPLGRGGMGEVFLAEHVLLKRPCAIKLIHADKALDRSTLERFEREVVATARLTHWNTIDIYDYGHTPDGTFYYVMELLEGENLHDLVRSSGPIPAERAAYLMIQACDALEEAHARGLIHRDIKPANLFSTTRGGHYDVLKVLDFGLVLEVESETSATGSDVTGKKGRFSGTPQYMAPEQASNYEGVDRRSDIYALGAVLYFLVTGRPPFEKANVLELIAAHMCDPVPSTRELVPSVPEAMDQIILKCLEKDRDLRFQYAKELGDALRSTQLANGWSSVKAREWFQS